MKSSVSRRAFMKASGAAAAGALASPTRTAAGQAQAPRAGRPQDELTAGMIDFHVHTSPDTAERTVNAIEAARTARDRGLRAIVLKGTAFETVTRASQAMAEVTGIQVFGGLVMNWSSGGINPAAVEAMVNLRGSRSEKVGRVVWLPSNDSRNHFQRFNIQRPPVDVFDGTKLVPAMHEVFALCVKHDLVLQTCHLSSSEALALIREAKAAGVEKIVCTHADYDPINMSIDDQRAAARLGAYIEHAFIGTFLGPDVLGGAVPAVARRQRRADGGGDQGSRRAELDSVERHGRQPDRHSGGRLCCLRGAAQAAGHHRRRAGSSGPQEPLGAARSSEICAHTSVASAFRRTVNGPARAGHYLQMKSAVKPDTTYR